MARAAELEHDWTRVKPQVDVAFNVVVEFKVSPLPPSLLVPRMLRSFSWRRHTKQNDTQNNDV
jgi:hypothetical protein